MNKVWVLLSEYNEYDQFGCYFLAVFKEKPDNQQLKEILPGAHESVILNLISHGGGRQGVEDIWYHLKEVEFGTLYYDPKFSMCY